LEAVVLHLGVIILSVYEKCLLRRDNVSVTQLNAISAKKKEPYCTFCLFI